MGFFVDYNTITVGNFVDIHKCLVKKNNIKQISNLLNKV